MVDLSTADRALPLLLAVLMGCQPATAPPNVPVTAQATSEAGGETAPPFSAGNAPVVFAEPPSDDHGGGRLVEETWDAHSMQGAPVGYTRTTVAEVEENGRTLLRTRSFLRLVLKREGQPVTQDMTLTSFDTPTGELVRFESRMPMGTAETVSTGVVERGELTIETATPGSVQQHSIPWQAEWGGFFAMEQSLRRQPLGTGEQRTLRCLMPFSNQPGEIHLEGQEQEEVDLPSGKARLLRVASTTEIASTIEMAGQRIETVLWLNEHGEPLKQVMPQIGQEALRTTKELALRPAAGGDYDLLIATTVPLVGQVPDHARTTRVVYRARLKSGSIEGMFAEGLSQRIRPIDEREVELTVIAVRPGRPREIDIPLTTPTDDDLAPSSLIQSDDPEVVKLAAGVLPGETDAWKLASGLERFVAGAVRNKNFSQAFASAAEVARSLEGDCTEHAVLLAALCRARGIPTRCAFGLVYYERQRGFAYHMWNEVWIGDRWVPLDGTLGLGGIGGGHIKLADSNLAGASAYTAMLPVINVLGRLELEVVSAE